MIAAGFIQASVFLCGCMRVTVCRAVACELERESGAVEYGCTEWGLQWGGAKRCRWKRKLLGEKAGGNGA